MVDWNKPVQTRDGEKVRVLCTDRPPPSPVVGYFEDTGALAAWHEDGRSCPGRESRHDLINIPEKHRYYAVMPKVLIHGSWTAAALCFFERKDAEAAAKEQEGIVVPVEWEE